jgi:hypothetical protein
MTTQTCVFMTNSGEIVTPLDYNGQKAVSVSTYRGVTSLHIRRYFGESELKYPTKIGISLTRQEFTNLIALQNELLEEFDRLQPPTVAPISPNYASAASTGDTGYNAPNSDTPSCALPSFISTIETTYGTSSPSFLLAQPIVPLGAPRRQKRCRLTSEYGAET